MFLFPPQHHGQLLHASQTSSSDARLLHSSTLPSCSARGFRLLKKEKYQKKKKKIAAAAQGYTLGLHDLLIARQRWRLREACTGKRCFVGCMCVLVRVGQLLRSESFYSGWVIFFFIIYFFYFIIMLTKSS